jgi:alpha-beta hydrolase superfamily lysophospholipase
MQMVSDFDSMLKLMFRILKLCGQILLIFGLLVVASVVFFHFAISPWNINRLFYRSPFIQSTHGDYFNAYNHLNDIHVHWEVLPIKSENNENNQNVWFIRVLPPAKMIVERVIVYFHANDAHLGSYHVVRHIRLLASNFNAVVYAMEYPGYALSEDISSQTSIAFAAKEFCMHAWNNAAIETNRITKPMIIHGHSMGAAVAASASAAMLKQHIAHDLVIEGGWTSTQQWLHNFLPRFVVSFVCPVRSQCLGNPWDTSSIMKQHGLPFSKDDRKIVFIVGSEDWITPAYMAIELQNLARQHSDKTPTDDGQTYQLMTLNGRGHSDTFDHEDYITMYKSALCGK